MLHVTLVGLENATATTFILPIKIAEAFDLVNYDQVYPDGLVTPIIPPLNLSAR